MQGALAASLRLVAANDVPISAAYKVNPISGCHTVGEQENRDGRETASGAGNVNPNVIHWIIKQLGLQIVVAQWISRGNFMVMFSSLRFLLREAKDWRDNTVHSIFQQNLSIDRKKMKQLMSSHHANIHEKS